MDKTDLMKRYEAETGKKSVRVMTDGIHAVAFDVWHFEYINWLESKAVAYDRLVSKTIMSDAELDAPLAQKILREMAEKAEAYDRIMGGAGCVYCNGPESLISDSHIEVEISDGKIHASEDEFGSGGWVKIEYCPMCGRHLTLPDGWEEAK